VGQAERHAGLLLGVILLVAAALRFREALATPLWFEELYDAALAHLPLRDVMPMAARDIHPPLGFLIEHFWQRLGGMNPAWLKTLPVLFALASIAATYRLCRRVIDTRTALLCTALVAVAHGHVRASQEVQPLSLEWCFVLLAVTAAWDWLERPAPRAAAAYVLWGACAMYTHYVSLAILFVIGVWGLLDVRRDRARLVPWLALQAVLALIFAPQVPTFIQQFIRDDAIHHGHFPYPRDWSTFVHQMSFSAAYLIPVCAVLALIPLFQPARRRMATLFWALIVLPPLSLRFWSLNFPRETMFVVPFFVALVSSGLLALPLRALRIGVASALIVLALRTNVVTPPFIEPNVLMKAVREVRNGARDGDLVIHSETHALMFFLFYDPAHAHRLLLPPGGSVPYYDGGLMVPDSCRMTPAEWIDARNHGRGWWAVDLNRTRVVRGQEASRTGVWEDSLAAGVPGVRKWDFPPLELWESPHPR
jgi:Dolichyl-phosphate-mannose-protein mannosyltransferase